MENDKHELKKQIRRETKQIRAKVSKGYKEVENDDSNPYEAALKPFDTEELETQTFSNKVLNEVKTFIDIMNNLVYYFYKEDFDKINFDEEDFSQIQEELYKILATRIINEELHIVLLILARV